MTIIDIGMANLTNYRLWLQLVPVLTIIDHSDVVAPTGCTVPPWWTEMRPYLGKLCWCPKAFRARRGKQRTSFAWQAQHLVLCKGSDVCPGVPWSPLLCRWLLRGRGGTWCSARGSDVRPGVPWSPVAFAWQARHLVLCSGGSDVRPGVPWQAQSPLGFCGGRRSTGCSARGRMYALASLGLWWLLRGRRGTWCSARGRMYAVASLGLRCSSGGFCVAGAALAALHWHKPVCYNLLSRVMLIK